MTGKECYHCGLKVVEGEAHDCWTTTEEKLTEDLPEALMDAWFRLRETAMGFGEQRVYASHKSIMFSRKVCYFFVRPKPARLEVCFFLGRPLKHPAIRRVEPTSKVKVAHLVHVTHRDEVEAPLTDWLAEAYAVSERLKSPSKKKNSKKKVRSAGRSKRKLKPRAGKRSSGQPAKKRKRH